MKFGGAGCYTGWHRFHGFSGAITDISLVRWWGIGLTLMVAFLGWTFAYADQAGLEYRIKAAYIYNFTKFVEWPNRVVPDDGTAPMTLCVLGDNPFRGALKSLENKTSQDKSLHVNQYIHWEPRDLVSCQVLFISASERTRLDSILQQLQYVSVLTVSDIENFAHRGGIIGFIVRDNKIRLEINLEAARQADLKIRAKLLEVATVVSDS